MTYATVNGQLLPAAEATVSIHDRGFRFGDGAFETIALHNGVPYQYEWHIKRLTRALEALKIRFDTPILQPYCRQLLNKNAARSGSLRIQVTRGSGSRGYLPAPPGGVEAPLYVIETSPAPTAPPPAVNLWLSTHRKTSSAALPVAFKLCQGVNSTLARLEAQAHGCFEALMLNEKGQIAEASSANIFWSHDNKLFTPPLSAGLVEGSTRAALMRLYDITEADCTLDELLEASAVMLTNASWGVLAASSLDPANHHWRDTVQALQMQRKLQEDRDRESVQHAAQWLIQ